MRQVFNVGTAAYQPTKWVPVDPPASGRRVVADGSPLVADIIVEVDVERLASHYGQVAISRKSRKTTKALGAIVIKAVNVRPKA